MGVSINTITYVPTGMIMQSSQMCQTRYLYSTSASIQGLYEVYKLAERIGNSIEAKGRQWSTHLSVCLSFVCM